MKFLKIKNFQHFKYKKANTAIFNHFQDKILLKIIPILLKQMEIWTGFKGH